MTMIIVLLGERADTLQKANVTVWSSEQCNRMFALQSKSLAITDRQLCAGRDGGGVDSCWVIYLYRVFHAKSLKGISIPQIFIIFTIH